MVCSSKYLIVGTH